MKDIVRYKNGNYFVTLNLKNGTKIRENNLSFFQADFPESFDFNITNKCDGGCPWCYQGCTPSGKHADIMNLDFLDNLRPFTEVAINGNDLSHPDLIPFLEKMKQKNIIVSMTVNQVHFNQHKEDILSLIVNDLIKGLGVSLRSATPEFIEAIKPISNAVIHVIAGIVTEEELNALANNNLKVLILGYKTINNGKKFIANDNNRNLVDSNIEWLKNNLDSYVKRFNVVSFDNLAIKQLEPQRLMSKEEWDEMFMGDDLVDGKLTSASMYIDGVNKEFAANSCSAERFPLMNSVDEMYQFLVNHYNKEGD